MIKKYSEEKRQMVIDAREDGATIAQIATQPELVKQRYYNRLYRTPAETVFEQRNDELSSIIKERFEASNGRFGANMIHVKMREQGIIVSRKQVKTLRIECNWSVGR